MGFRNPWFSFDRNTGELYAADVGQDEVEEIDIVTPGGNHGWRVLEGTRCTTLAPASCSDATFSPPIAEYGHVDGRCSITGGYVYRGLSRSLPQGAYLYADLCTGELLLLKDGMQTVLLDTDLIIVSFGEDESGELYVVDHSGTIWGIRDADARPRAQLISD